MVFEKRALRRRNGPKEDEMTGNWRKTHNAELRSLKSSPSKIRLAKPRRIRWAGLVKRLGKRGMHIGFWWESQKEREH
jgi:hypothetical protein